MSCCGSPDASATRGSASNPFVIRQGSTFEFTLRFFRNGSPRDLSDRTGSGHLRSSPGRGGTPLAEFEVTVRDPQTGSGRGRVDVRLGATVTAYPQIQAGDYVFDIEVTSDSDPDDVISTDLMHLRLLPEVTL